MNTAILARPVGDGFQGRTIPDAPDCIPQLKVLYRDTFNGDLGAMTNHLINGAPLVDQDDAHSAGATHLYLMERHGVTTFDAERLDGRHVWTWRSTTAWSTA